jgi:two-component system, NarL family, nitrate/nitrite response regulator NarL
MNRRQAAAVVRLGPKPALSGDGATRPQGGGGIANLTKRAFPIVIIDPQTLFRRGLALLVRQWHPGASVFDTGDIGQALSDMGLRPRPELLLVDSYLASQWNFAGLSQLVGRLPSTPIILLANEPDAHTAARAVEIGARGYVSKATSEAVLRHALALAVSGEIYLPREFFKNPVGLHAAPQGSRPLRPDSPLRKLTYRQSEVLSHLAHGRSNKEIARCLGLLESTVKVHVKTILKKLAAANRTQAAMLAVEMGWARRLDA